MFSKEPHPFSIGIRIPTYFRLHKNFFRKNNDVLEQFYSKRVEIYSNQLIQKTWYVLARLRKIISDKINITMLTVIFISWGNINHRLLQLSNLFCISKWFSYFFWLLDAVLKCYTEVQYSFVTYWWVCPDGRQPSCQLKAVESRRPRILLLLCYL